MLAIPEMARVLIEIQGWGYVPMAERDGEELPQRPAPGRVE